MKYARELVLNTIIGGALVLVPIYLAVLLLLKGMQSVVGLVRPVAALLPDWVPGETFWALLIVLSVCLPSVPPCVPGQGERPESGWRGRSLEEFPATRCFAA